MRSSSIRQYDPTTAPDPDTWQALSEDERIEMVREYHRNPDDELPSDEQNHFHAAIHVVVENQLATGVEPVVETFARLTRQGLDRHNAVHAIGSVLIELIFKGIIPDGTDPTAKYAKKLKKLSAKKWLKGEW